MPSKLDTAIDEVIKARKEAVAKHGELKSGPMRWCRLLGEEYWESIAELEALIEARTQYPTKTEHDATKLRAIAELAQLAQLCIGVIELIQDGRTHEQD